MRFRDSRSFPRIPSRTTTASKPFVNLAQDLTLVGDLIFLAVKKDGIVPSKVGASWAEAVQVWGS